jgi:hypothetical protein
MADRILHTTAPASIPHPHAYDDPDLSPVEFLQHVMHATHLPMATRIEAASALLPYTHPTKGSAPRSVVPARCKIIIGGLGPCDPSPSASHDPTGNHSQNRVSLNKTLTRDGRPHAPSNIETTSYPYSLPDYSIPPTPTELQEIKAAVHALRPDLAHLPIPEPRLCACGHWVSSPCPLGEQCREKSKLN